MTMQFNSTRAIKTAALISGLTLSFAGIAQVSLESFQRLSSDALSGSGHSVRSECGGGIEGYEGAKADLMLAQKAGMSKVKIRLQHAKPHTVYTVWLRVKGNDADGSFGGSPLTGGGATPLAPGSDLVELLQSTPPNPGNAFPLNGFTTDAQGNGKLSVRLDFPLLGGSYPFNLLPDGLIPGAREIPVAIVNPAQPGVSAPFMLRIVSHCQDGLGHGLSPGAREAWFDWPE